MASMKKEGGKSLQQGSKAKEASKILSTAHC